MKEYKKWNGGLHRYEPYYVDDDKRLCLYSEDMDLEIDCCQCLKPIKYGETYTSKEVHNGVGFGYAVCPKCYEEEWERRRVWKNQKESSAEE